MRMIPNPAAAGLDAERLDRIEKQLPFGLRRAGQDRRIFRWPVGRRGQLAYRATVGTMDLETGAALDDQTIWRLYSMTKPITGVALLSLIERRAGEAERPDPSVPPRSGTM